MSKTGPGSTLLRAAQIFGISRKACSKIFEPIMVSGFNRHLALLIT
jgi:hypothetical protein